MYGNMYVALYLHIIVSLYICMRCDKKYSEDLNKTIYDS